MYSVVLLAAMSTTAEAPAFGGTFWLKHCFFDSCFPARYGWTNGPGLGGYYPTGYSSCYGCGGCYGYHHVGSVGHYRHGCGGCYGGGWGYGWPASNYVWHTCAGCFGAPGYGLYGSSMEPIGHPVGYGGFSGYGNFGMYGATSTPIMADRSPDPLGLDSGHSLLHGAPIHGGISGGSTFTPSYTGTPSIGTPSGADTSPTPSSEALPPGGGEPKVNPPGKNPFPSGGFSSSPSTNRLTSTPRAVPGPKSGSILIQVPANARVYVDGNLMNSESTLRRFHSPELEPGYKYSYVVKVEYQKGGKNVTEEKTVYIRPGELTRVAIGDDATSVAAK